MNEVIPRAAEFARAAHGGIDQRRKYSKEPYIVHPEAVARLVSTVTDDAPTIAAAWLHDVVEDTPVTIEQVEEEFGSDIARLVADLTDVSRKSDGNRAHRKAIDREHTARADPRAKTVKLADVIHNLGDIVNLAPDFAPVYLEEKVLLLAVLTEGHPDLFRQASERIEDSKRQIADREAP